MNVGNPALSNRSDTIRRLGYSRTFEEVVPTCLYMLKTNEPETTRDYTIEYLAALNDPNTSYLRLDFAADFIRSEQRQDKNSSNPNEYLKSALNDPQSFILYFVREARLRIDAATRLKVQSGSIAPEFVARMKLIAQTALHYKNIILASESLATLHTSEMEEITETKLEEVLKFLSEK